MVTVPSIFLMSSVGSSVNKAKQDIWGVKFVEEDDEFFLDYTKIEVSMRPQNQDIKGAIQCMGWCPGESTSLKTIRYLRSV